MERVLYLTEKQIANHRGPAYSGDIEDQGKPIVRFIEMTDDELRLFHAARDFVEHGNGGDIELAIACLTPAESI